MEQEYNHLNHNSTWECKYHVVFTPKYRKKMLFGKIKLHLGQVFHDLARRKECRIEEGHLMSDHVHMLISIPPKYSVAEIIGYRVDLAFVPALTEMPDKNLFWVTQAKETSMPQLSAPPKDSFSTNGNSVNGHRVEVLPAPRAAPSERTLPNPSIERMDSLTRIRDFLKIADFKEKDSDVRNYVALTRQALQDGHSTQELFMLFSGCFTPIWQRNGVIDQKTFEYHLTNPERLRFYKINQDAVAAVLLPGRDESMAGASRPVPEPEIKQRHHTTLHLKSH